MKSVGSTQSKQKKFDPMADKATDGDVMHECAQCVESTAKTGLAGL